MDFRDIEAFDADTAVIMGITNPAVILRTVDGGKSWKKVFEDTAKGAFLDAMDFNGNQGSAIGDPIHQLQTYLLYTRDRGNTWEKQEINEKLDEGEAFFASSGTNIKMMGNHPVYASGGKSSNLYYAASRFPIPIMKGRETTGVNSLAVFDSRRAIVVGGDFMRDSIPSDNCVLLDLQGANVKFTLPKTPPHGYRSCVIYLNKKTLLTCGTSGVDISNDGGKNWKLITRDGFHVCQKAKKGNAVFLAGNGKIARLDR